MGEKTHPRPRTAWRFFRPRAALRLWRRFGTTAILQRHGLPARLWQSPGRGARGGPAPAASRAACALAVLTALLCVLAWLRYRFHRPYPALALLCLCFCGSAAWPLFQALGGRGQGWTVAERVVLLRKLSGVGRHSGAHLQGAEARVLARLRAGAAVCATVALQPLFPVSTAGPLMFYASCLGAYKWFTAAWLLGASVWGCAGAPNIPSPCWREAACSPARWCWTSCCPLHEPILLGWFVEMAGRRSAGSRGGHRLVRHGAGVPGKARNCSSRKPCRRFGWRLGAVRPGCKGICAPYPGAASLKAAIA